MTWLTKTQDRSSFLWWYGRLLYLLEILWLYSFNIQAHLSYSEPSLFVVLSGVLGFSEPLEKLRLKLFRQQKLPCSREVCSPLLKGLRSKSSEENICWKQSVFIFLCLVLTWIAAVCRAGPSVQLHLEIRYKLLIPATLSTMCLSLKLIRSNKTNHLQGVCFGQKWGHLGFLQDQSQEGKQILAWIYFNWVHRNTNDRQ